MTKYLQITNHIGTIKNLTNVFTCLGKKKDFTVSNCDFPLFISEECANEIWNNYKNKLSENIKFLFFTDTTMYARPFLQNMEDHNFIIVIYICNRYHWGIWNNNYELDKYNDLYSQISNHDRVIFCSDNNYDQYLAKINNIHFYYDNIIRLTPIINEPTQPITSKMFIHNRGTDINNYSNILQNLGIEYDVYGNGNQYRDILHICEYKGIIHLPYQVNIQSLWENIGYCIVYFIPSKKFIIELIKTTEWYYWEEKYRNDEIFFKSIELSEWYLPENEGLFEYFNDWDDLKFKIDNCNFEYKKNYIYEYILESNKTNLKKWDKILNYNVN